MFIVYGDVGLRIYLVFSVERRRRGDLSHLRCFKNLILNIFTQHYLYMNHLAMENDLVEIFQEMKYLRMLLKIKLLYNFPFFEAPFSGLALVLHVVPPNPLGQIQVLQFLEFLNPPF
jgi:hypothetical protein